jgi:hypothetical protein
MIKFELKLHIKTFSASGINKKSHPSFGMAFNGEFGLISVFQP